MFSLTTTHLRFVCEATTPLRLEADTFRAGSNLRGALGQVMMRTYCAGNPSDLEHVAQCPVHWLLAANLKPGEERRGYALVPPLADAKRDCLQAGDTFEFGLTLFGNTRQFLPYFVLAVPEMGRMGIGPGRGKFRLKRIWALNPLTGESERLLEAGSNLVHTPTLVVDHSCLQQRANGRLQMREGKDVELEIEFVTPMRLIRNEQTVKVPEFSALFGRLLERVDELNQQFADGSRRAVDEVKQFQELAARVQSVEVHTRWVEVWSGSQRRGAASPLSGFVGRARFAAPLLVWRALLPWLLWGELVQVGKDTVKGNGVLKISE